MNETARATKLGNVKPDAINSIHMAVECAGKPRHVSTEARIMGNNAPQTRDAGWSQSIKTPAQAGVSEMIGVILRGVLSQPRRERRRRLPWRNSLRAAQALTP